MPLKSIAGINTELKERRQSNLFDFLPEGKQYILTLITDGNHDKNLTSRYRVVDKNSIVEVILLGRGGVCWFIKTNSINKMPG